MPSKVDCRRIYVVAFLTILESTNLAQATDMSSKFTYDPDGRLTTAAYDETKCVVYAYDANGNRISQNTLIPLPTPPHWGALPWGCFVWKSN
jgi:YD repeat-containing protein